MTTDKQTWTIDPAHSRVQFSVKHMVITEVVGNFTKYDLKMTTTDDKFENAQIEFTVDTSTVDTGIADRNTHLKSDDFFGADKYPQMIFKSKSFKEIDEENYKLSGDLTIRNITKPIELDVEFGGRITDPWGNDRAGFTIKGVINRFDYDLKWNSLIETGGAVVGKNVKINSSVEVVKAK